MTDLERLQVVGNYTIASEKVDNCTPDWEMGIICIGVIGLILFAVLSLFFMFEDEFLFRIFFLGAVISTIFTFVPMFTKGCGVRIYLISSDEDESNVTTAYRFTKNPDKDIVKVKKIVDNFVIKANKNMKEYEAKKEMKKECCIRYNSIVKKVKE